MEKEDLDSDYDIVSRFEFKNTKTFICRLKRKEFLEELAKEAQELDLGY